MKNIVKFHVKSKRKELESQQNFVEYLINNKEKIVQKLYKETQHSNDSSLEDSLRSSMESEELSADVQSLYVGMIQEIIFKNWQEPLAEKHNLEAVISFFIFRGGNIDKPLIKKSSGVEALDTLAVRAILDSVPFPEFPKELKMSNLHINIYFKYVPKLGNLRTEEQDTQGQPLKMPDNYSSPEIKIPSR